MRLADLLVAVADVDGIERVRLSSIEINHLTDGLLEAFSHPGVARTCTCRCNPATTACCAPCDAGTDRAGFLARMQRARAAVDGLNLTTDVIVGHPAEDEPAFSNTLTAVELAGFSKVHVFRYSPRPDTVDAASDPVPRPSRRIARAGCEPSPTGRVSVIGRRCGEHANGSGGGKRRRWDTPPITPVEVGGPVGELVEVVA